MKKKSILLFSLTLFIISAYCLAKDPQLPKPILTKGDVEHFIKTFPLLSQDFKNFGVKHEAKSGNMTYPDALKTNSEFMGILKKHGWDENYFQKAGTIIMGYSSTVYGQNISKAQKEFEKSLKEIENNPHLSPEMKEQLKQSLMAAQGIMTGQGAELKKRIHPDDLKQITAYLEELKKIIDTKPEDK